ncbi:hypothetical protein, partial [Serratia marcescens]|uniref:hypothetical protein n=1 Tax=Serratia marcescens TaxID=615 RepID=UPI00281400ED
TMKGMLNLFAKQLGRCEEASKPKPKPEAVKLTEPEKPKLFLLLKAEDFGKNLNQKKMST